MSPGPESRRASGSWRSLRSACSRRRCSCPDGKRSPPTGPAPTGRGPSGPPLAPGGLERVDDLAEDFVADPRPAALVVEHVAGRRVAVAGRQPDVAAADLAELGRAGFQERSFELVELLIVGDLEVEVDAAGRVVHVCIVNAAAQDLGTLR